MSNEFKYDYILMGDHPANPIYSPHKTITFINNSISVPIGDFKQIDLTNQVAQSTIKIIEAVNSSSNSGTSSAILVAFFGAFSAYAFSYLQQHNERKLNRIKNTSKSILDLIATLEELSLKYWITGYNVEKKDDISIDEARIKSINPLIAKHMTILLSYLNKSTLKKYNAGQLSVFPSAIFTLTTGGDFESPNRVQSKQTATAISKKCLEAITVIKAISP